MIAVAKHALSANVQAAKVDNKLHYSGKTIRNTFLIRSVEDLFAGGA